MLLVKVDTFVISTQVSFANNLWVFPYLCSQKYVEGYNLFKTLCGTHTRTHTHRERGANTQIRKINLEKGGMRDLGKIILVNCQLLSSK